MQAMNVSVPDHRLPVMGGPSFRRPIEVRPLGEHRVVLDTVEEIAMAVEQTPET